MLASVDLNGRPFHFIGIGGIGMSALAHILAKRKLPVSGSDLRSSHITEQLQALGARIFRQQEAANLESLCGGSNGNGRFLPQVVCSTAIHANNLEYQAAVGLGCPILHRSDLLGSLMLEYQSIAVAGTHGKTTTSSLIGYLLLQAGLDPTIIIGGEVKAWAGNARVGEGPYLVAEADESDGSLVKFSPQIGVITNIELDHPDHYSSLEEVVEIFQSFAENCRVLVVCLDCPTIRDRIITQPQQEQTLISYGIEPETQADYRADQVVYGATGTVARIWEREQVLGELHLPLLGRHNLCNALAAIAVGRRLGLDFPTIAAAIATFEGARRRFEIRGEVQGMCFLDDYAHHPSEVQATLAAARLRVTGSAAAPGPWQRLVAVFQPHRYSRSLKFLAEFGTGFSDADLVIVTDIYSAGEIDQGLIRGEQVAAAIAAHHPQVHYQPTLKQVSQFLQGHLQPGDFVVFLGAGNLNQIIPEVIAYFETRDLELVPEVAVS